MAESRKTFALGSFEASGEQFPGVVDGDSVYDLRPIISGVRVFADLFEAWEQNLDTIEAFLKSSPGAEATAEGLRVLPPVQPVGTVFAAGANYREHILQITAAHKLGRPGASEKELLEEAAHETDERARTGDPYVWVGIPSAVSGAYDDIVLPDVGDKLDWEVELAVVIGKHGYRVDATEAMDYVAGYTICNDLTQRSLVSRTDMPMMGTDWFRSKNQPGFFPTGPYVLPARLVQDPADLRILMTLNGEVKQDAYVNDLLFNIPQLISYVTAYAAVRPGDILITGSPAGNGSHWGRFLREGDVMEATIPGCGTQRTRVVRSSGQLPPWYTNRESHAILSSLD
ncbi:fumarylacetoacetate hydrolase family protein [Kocuria sp.]|uniref:fumarylacetoacetate hydrolase family protein n=1 Tax=Kocuria TaxID=57493 RepID=UPI0025BF288C|nr:fumarylacetoacetate hydrolase family protein [Kocuria sp.]